MEPGKQICRILKDIRKRIAEENNIEFITSECSHKGDCAGTCPKCEAELRYLESQLARRSASGLSSRLAGVALGIAAVAPVLTSCDWRTTGDPVPPQLNGDVAESDSIKLGADLVFAIISHDDFMSEFSKGGWLQTAIYNVYPDGSTDENILENIIGYSPVKMAVKDEKIKYYISYNHTATQTYTVMDFNYNQWGNNLRIGNLHDYIVAAINETEMICYGPVFSQEWAPDAFLGKYLFTHVNEETVSEWDKQHNIQAE